MKSINLVFLAIASLVVSACAHHRDVRPGEDVHRVVVQTDDAEEGARSAIEQANHFCKERKQYAVFVQEDKKYTGDMDEQTYKNTKRAATVAKTVGGGVWVFGGQRESALGGLAGLGGAAADAVAGKGYTVEMKFKCK